MKSTACLPDAMAALWMVLGGTKRSSASPRGRDSSLMDVDCPRYLDRYFLRLAAYSRAPLAPIRHRANSMLTSYQSATCQSGQPAVGRRVDVQVVRSPDPAKTANEFFDKLSLGGRIQPLPRGNGVMGRFDDDSGVVYRPSSKSGGPAVNITIVGKYGDEYKIHFER